MIVERPRRKKAATGPACRTTIPLLLLASLLLLTVLLAACGSADGAGTPVAGGSSEIIVSAASDLAPVLEELAPLFEEETGLRFRANLGSTGQLMEQIAAGARVDVFLSASKSAVDQLDEKGLLVPGSVQPYGVGRVVMLMAPGSLLQVQTIEDLLSPEIERISIANPDHAPYGRAARESLESVGLWDELQPKLVPAENVRQAFQFVESGNVDVGLVALSLVAIGDGRWVLVPDELHGPLNQTLAIVADSPRQEEAKQFVSFLTGDEGRRLLEKYGFLVPQED